MEGFLIHGGSHDLKLTEWPSLVVAILIVVLPLPGHWVLISQPHAGIYAESTNVSLYVGDVVMLALLGGTAVTHIFKSKAQRAKASKDQKRTPLLLTLLGALTVLTLISSVWALDAVLAFQQGMRLLVLWGLVMTIAQHRLNPTILQYGIALSILCQAGVALGQFFTQDDLGLRLLGEIDLNRYPGGGSILTVGNTYWLRGYGLTPHPNILGGVLAALLLMGTAVYLQAPRRSRAAWLLPLLLGSAGLVITFSRSAWLGGVVGGATLTALLLLKKDWRLKYGRLLMLLIGLVLLVTLPLLWSQRALLQTRLRPSTTTTETRSINERQALAEIGRDLFETAPLTGIGAANFAIAAIPTAGQSSQIAAQPIHNVPQLLAIELGVSGGLLWSALMLLPLLSAINQHRTGQLSVWTAGVSAALVALAVIDLFDYYAWGWAQGRLLRWTLWGIWLAAAARPQKQPGQS